MAKTIAHLYIGHGETEDEFAYSDRYEWNAVLSLLEEVATGPLPRVLKLRRQGVTGGAISYLITHGHRIRWIEYAN